MLTATVAATLDGVSAPITVAAGVALPASSTPPASSAAPTDPPPTGAACDVRYSAYVWDTYLTSSITVTNTGATTITSWALRFTLPTGQRITSHWNAVYSPVSGRVTARGLDDHVSIGPGGAIVIGSVATHTGDTSVPSSFTLNGTPCSLG
ncbi:cellulose binding domain-containing protein [Micromonospora sp. WMMD882]|uniref:cellulose binding domain-containing protein n=1 Tax=Micromonospora sp. WMMD882 TaxID=3015151 RepID=UPI00248B0847|nr:cellulose binding domain-containing protein [Micromonospora sp. WMMD882]WBB80061.1 cellulose binding domain-containing protein [Micromonospora sp. WMMD882]